MVYPGPDFGPGFLFVNCFENKNPVLGYWEARRLIAVADQDRFRRNRGGVKNTGIFSQNQWFAIGFLSHWVQVNAGHLEFAELLGVAYLVVP